MTPADAREVTWLKRIAKVPRVGTWPRLMTGRTRVRPAPTGPQFIAWVKANGRWPLWWWQQLAALRMLEHDADGRLVWRHVPISTSRQVGKCYLLAMLAMWRITQAPELFGEPQNVLHVAQDMNTARVVQQPMRVLRPPAPRGVQGAESPAPASRSSTSPAPRGCCARPPAATGTRARWRSSTRRGRSSPTWSTTLCAHPGPAPIAAAAASSARATRRRRR